MRRIAIDGMNQGSCVSASLKTMCNQMEATVVVVLRVGEELEMRIEPYETSCSSL